MPCCRLHDFFNSSMRLASCVMAPVKSSATVSMVVRGPGSTFTLTTRWSGGPSSFAVAFGTK